MNLHEQSELVTSVKLDDVKTSNLHMADVAGSFDDHFHAVFGEAFNRLLRSKSLSDVVEAFKYAIHEIGHSEVVMAILLCLIYETAMEDKKYLPSLGYHSLSDFIKDLKGTGINNRANFYNFVKIGTILLHSAFFNPATIEDDRIKITYNELFANFSKVKCLWHIEKCIIESRGYWKEDLFTHADVKYHFLNDTYRDFERYIKDIKAKFDELDHKNTKGVSGNRKSTIQVMQPMTGKLKEIYHEIHAGRCVGLFPNISQEFLESARDCIESRLKRKQDELNRCMENSPNFVSSTVFYESLENIEKGVVDTVKNYSAYMGAVLYFSPNTLKAIIRDSFGTETDYILAEAFLINRLHTETDLKNCLPRYGVTKIKDFAYSILDIGESQYKRLKKIGANLKLAESLQGEIDLLSPGFLEKIYFLDKAFNNHKNDPLLITRYLNCLSAKEFREFARNSSYCRDNEPIVQKDYKKALSLYREYETLLEKHGSVAMIGIHLEKNLEWLREIISNTRIGEKRFRQFYPEIPWTLLGKREPKTA
jgi:hypothetical protein